MTRLYWLADMEGNPVKAPVPPGEYRAYPNPFTMFKDASETATISVSTFGELVARFHHHHQLPRVTTRQRRAQTRQYAAADRKAKRPRITQVSVHNKVSR